MHILVTGAGGFIGSHAADASPHAATPTSSSALALLSFIGYAFMEARYFLEKWIPGDGAAIVETIVLPVDSR